MIKLELSSLRDNISSERGKVIFDFNITFAMDIIENTKYYTEEYGYENVILFIDEELSMINDELSSDNATRKSIDTLWYKTLNHLDYDYNFMMAKIEYLGDDIKEDMREFLVSSLNIVDIIEGLAEDSFQKKAYELLSKEVLVKKVLKKFEK